MTFYEELGLSEGASREEIRQAYKRLARLLHPDRCSDAAARALAEMQMRRLNGILALLCDPVQRADYDRGLLEGLRRPRRGARGWSAGHRASRRLGGGGGRRCRLWPGTHAASRRSAGRRAGCADEVPCTSGGGAGLVARSARAATRRPGGGGAHGAVPAGGLGAHTQAPALVQPVTVTAVTPEPPAAGETGRRKPPPVLRPNGPAKKPRNRRRKRVGNVRDAPRASAPRSHVGNRRPSPLRHSRIRANERQSGTASGRLDRRLVLHAGAEYPRTTATRRCTSNCA